jgi:hypothetical protein
MYFSLRHILRQDCMSGDSLILRTSINSSLKRSVLLRGTILAVLGAVVILAGGFISKGVLNVWGLPLYFVGIGLIAIGLIPQRKLQLLENNPNEIHIDHELIFTFRTKGKPVFSIPLASIRKIEFMERDTIYVLALWFVQPPIHNIILFNSAINLKNLHADSKKKFSCDLFLAYFSKRSLQKLFDFVEVEAQKLES